MAVGYSSFFATSAMNAACNNTSYAEAQLYMQLHTGDPGANGTANVATETDRVAVSFGTASSGAVANDTAIEWTSVAASEDYTHFTLWDASTSGNFIWSGTITAAAVSAGNDFTIAIGDCDLTMTPAS